MLLNLDAFDVLRLKWKDVLTGGADFNPNDPDIAKRIEKITETARNLRDSMIRPEHTDYLWEDLNDPNSSAQMSVHYNRLEAMALAYATKGSSLFQNPGLLKDLIDALDWLYMNRYNEQQERQGNWFDWDVATPISLDNIMVMLYDELGPERIGNYGRAVEKFGPVVDKRPSARNSDKTDIFMGANRVWKCIAVGLKAIIVKDQSKLSHVRDGLSIVFENVTSGNGFYPDGSFLQHHKHPYNGGYGKALIENLANILYLLADSPWEVQDPQAKNVFGWVYDAFEPFIYKGAMMDMVRGREVARYAYQDHVVGHQVIRGIIRLAQFAPPDMAKDFKSMVKYWIQTDTFKNYYEDATINLILLGKQIMADPAVVSWGERVEHRRYPYMDRVVHRRPGFVFALSMSSQRTYNFEALMGENLKGWYQGDGMTFLYNDDLSHYSDDFWATVNPYRLPGTTVDTRTRDDWDGNRYESPSFWTGGADVAGKYGVAGMELIACGSTLRARKSWFMFDDEIVCLGSGISSEDGRTIETIMENRKIADNTVLVNGTIGLNNFNQPDVVENVEWLHIEGVGGYYFPEPTDVTVIREARTGSWSDISNYLKFTSDAKHTRNYVTFWLNHGVNPADAKYAFVILPNKKSMDIVTYAMTPDISILESSNEAHGVCEKTLNLTAVNFWEDKVKRVGNVTCNAKASVMMYQNGNQLEVAVSDPTQQNEGQIELDINMMVSGVVSTDPRVTVSETASGIKLSINVRDAFGKSIKAIFKL